MRILKYLVWRLPKKIVKSGISLLNMEKKPIYAETMARRRPLHTCGTSVLAIARNACVRAQDFDEPLGSVARRAVAFFDLFFPFVYGMLCRWLAMLSLMDDHILIVEQTVEIIFPPSKRLFDKIDVLICNAEVLPQHFDDVLRRLSIIMHQIPFLDWILAHLISWLNFLVSILNVWGSKSSTAGEKEITIDENSNSTHTCKPETEEKPAFSSQEKANTARDLTDVYDTQIEEESPMYRSAVSSPLSDCSRDEFNPFGLSGMSKSNSMKCTYKEMLEKGTKEDGERTEDEEFSKAPLQ